MFFTCSQPSSNRGILRTGPRVCFVRNGFTLIEVLVVVAIMGLLLAVASPILLGSIQASRLTAAGDELMFKLSQARQTSLSENRPVEVRFYSYEEEGETACHAFQLFYHEATASLAVPVENPVIFADKDVVLVGGGLSPLANPVLLGNGWPKEATVEPFKSRGATYTGFTIFPDGTTSIAMPLRQSCLTLVAGGKVTSGTPPNYYTVQIDPVTARPRSYRP